jgi:hypothetical protein
VSQPPPPPPSAPWTTPAPPAPSWAPGPPKRRRRRPWIWLLVGSVVAILGLAVASGTVWIAKIVPPIDAANDYMDDLSDRNYVSAFDRLCAAEQIDASPEGLAIAVGDLDLDDYEVSPFDVDRDGSRATVKVDLTPYIGSDDDRFLRLRLQEIDGDWRPCGGQYGFVGRGTSDETIL